MILTRTHKIAIALASLLVVIVVIVVATQKSTPTPVPAPAPVTPVVPMKIAVSKIADANNVSGVGYGGTSNVTMVYDGNLAKTSMYNPVGASVAGNAFNGNIVKFVATLSGTYKITGLEYSFINDAAHAPSRIQIYAGDQSVTLTPTSTNYAQQFVKDTDFTLATVIGDVQTITLNLKQPLSSNIVTVQIWSNSGYQNYPVELVFYGTPA